MLGLNNFLMSLTGEKGTAEGWNNVLLLRHEQVERIWPDGNAHR